MSCLLPGSKQTIMTHTPFRISMAQLNPLVGDLTRNLEAIRKARASAMSEGADLLVTPEMSLAGYPAEDLILKPFFIKSVRACVEVLAKDTSDGGPAVIVGAPWICGGELYNAALVLENGAIKNIVRKTDLPNYGVFDEKRVFKAAQPSEPIIIKGHSIGLMICEDMWFSQCTAHLKEQGANILIAITASPFETAKGQERLVTARKRVKESGLPLIFVNQAGGQDEVIFDGTSFALASNGEIRAQCAGFDQDYQTLDCELDGKGRLVPQQGRITPAFSDLDAIYQATMLGLRDYVTKNGFPGVLIGLSGGLDSALTAAIAVDALGPSKVRTVMLQSPYTSDESLEDAAKCADLLKVHLDAIPIDPAMAAFDNMLKDKFKNTKSDTTEENIQARIRGVVLMALSNKFGDLLLTTGNKSEISIGYSTLYGDMSGGYSVLKDIYKSTVFTLSRRRNEGRPLNGLGPKGPAIPERVITKPPSAELRPDQTDADSLPPYDQLDDILYCLVEESMASADIVERGHDPETVARVEHMLYVAEYKRRQAAPGVKITRKSFGRDRRYPITNGFRTARRPCQ